MAKFLSGNKLNAAIEDLFDLAGENILIISPYIKLHQSFASVLLKKKEIPKLRITIVFGKNEENPSKSMKQADLDFFKEFPNVEIRYKDNLHAKYYSNEECAILTSMNLHSYSQDNNIEAGIQFNYSFFNELSKMVQDSVDEQAAEYFKTVIKQSSLLYSREPEFESTNFGLTKRYKVSIVIVDKLSEFFNKKSNSNIDSHKENKEESEHYGYCIKTGQRIPFNIKHPLSTEAYKIWAKTKNESEPQNYCHFSGEISNGKNSYSKPILSSNWKKAKSIFGLI